MPFVITGEANGTKLYWRKWTSASVSGRPKWVNKLSPKCLYDNENTARKTANGEGSGHWTVNLPSKRPGFELGTPVTNVLVEEVPLG